MADTSRGTLAVDLDKTLAKSQEPFSVYTIGEPVPEILQAVRDEIATGRRVIIFTARAASNEPGVMRIIREWLTRHGLGDLKITCQKTPDITEFWDDRAKPVTPNEGFTEKEAMQMVRKTRMVEQYDDHCPHCDHKFHEKGYPRPDHAQAEREGIDIMEADELCPNCGGIVDSPEMTDEAIDKTTWGGDDFKQKLRDQRQRKRDRIAARLTPATGLPRKVPLDDLLRAAGSKSPQSSSAPPAISEEAKEASRRDGLRNLWLRKGQCPKCGGVPESTTPDDAGDVECSKCHWLWELALGKTASATAAKHKLWHGSPTGNLTELEPRHDPRTGQTAVFASADPVHALIHALLRTRANTSIEHSTHDGVFTRGTVQTPEDLLPNGHLCELDVDDADVEPHDGNSFRITKRIKPTSIYPVTSEDATQAGWAIKKAADYTETVPKPLKHFSRPENWDPYDKLGDVELLCGSNDWECANTWLWAEGDGQRVWIELKFPKNHPCFEKYTDADEAEWKAHADAAKQAWLAAAKKKSDSPRGRSDLRLQDFADALKSDDMTPFIAASGTDKLRVKEASAAPPTTGPHALVHALKSLDLEALEKEARDHIASGKITRRDKGVKMLNVLQGLKRNKLEPHELMITRVPVLPAAFRPYAMMGSTYIPGAANELYSDLFKHKAIHEETMETLGEGGAGLSRRNLLGAVRALYGYGDPVSPKLLQRGTQGYLHEITGDSPKFGFVNRRLVSKPIDSVGRSVITVNPELDMNQIAIPEEMAWDMLGSLVQRRLSRSGMPLAATIKHLKDRSPEARRALDQELKERPGIYSRSPAWHKFNTIAGYVQIHGGNDIQISPYVTAGHNADFDGDQINLNFPIMPASVQEAKDKLMPDKMLFTIKDPEATMALPKHEMLLSLAAAASRPSLRHHVFASRAEALDGIKRNNVKLEDSVEFPD
ncbi:MAG: hypothetical protein ACR2IJ_08100 [Fluviibacter sp.]